MLQRTYIFVLLMLLSCMLHAQNAKQADEFFNNRQYAEARAIYDALLRKQPSHPLYLYRAARCAQEVGDAEAAEALFIKAGTKYPLRNFFLGELYYSRWRMAEAIAAYEAFLPSIDENHERWPIVQQRIESAQIIARYLKHVARVEVLDVKHVAGADLLNAYMLSEETGLLELDSVGSSFTTQRGDRRYYSVRIDREDSTERTMLVSQQRLLEHWETPDTLRSTVNSGKRNAYPFVLTDGATLYFASDREGGLGGLDIYITRYNAALGEWLPAENIGMPYNSPADDYLFVADEQKGHACFATNRHYPDTADSVDVYQIALGERSFLRGLPHQELVALARLDSLVPLTALTQELFAETTTSPSGERQSETKEEAHPEHTKPATGSKAKADSIYFVLNDTETYTSLSDFRSDSARVLYEQYMRMEHQQLQAEQMLDSLRVRYYDADSATRASLQARIPILSDEITRRKRTMRETLTRIRTLEAQ